MLVGDETPGCETEDCSLLPRIETAPVRTFCAGFPDLIPGELPEEHPMEPVLTGGHVVGQKLSSEDLNFFNVGEAHLPLAPQEDIISLFSHFLLYKHPCKEGTEQKGSQCLT